jgi:hypothetical protein
VPSKKQELLISLSVLCRVFCFVFFVCVFGLSSSSLSFEILLFRNGQPDRYDDHIIFVTMASIYE